MMTRGLQPVSGFFCFSSSYHINFIRLIMMRRGLRVDGGFLLSCCCLINFIRRIRFIKIMMRFKSLGECVAAHGDVRGR